MPHTYDSLRALAVQAVTTPSLDADDATEVLTDALREAGVMLISFSADWAQRWFGVRVTAAEHARAYERAWVLRWAFKAVYGASAVRASGPFIRLEPNAEPDHGHRQWSIERIEARRRGEVFQPNRKRGCKPGAKRIRTPYETPIK